jgi:hypothetical protein
MKRRGVVLGCVFFLVSASSTVQASSLTLVPPPGWKDAGAAGASSGAVIALKGPEKSSFVVKRVSAVSFENQASVRGYLRDVLQGMREASHLGYRSNGRVETRTFRNGLSVRLMRAQIKGEDRLALGLFESGGAVYLAVLMSAAPEAMLPSLLGTVDFGAAAGDSPASEFARSLDGQLELAVGGGLTVRALTEMERSKGFVLAVQGSGAEIVFQKLSGAEATKPAEQAAITRELAAAAAGTTAGKAAPVRAAASAAGPVGVYSWAPMSGETDMRAAVGYLPWAYWGYQLFGRGPDCDQFLIGVLAALKAGPSAMPALVAGSPRIPIESGPFSGRRIWAMLGAGSVIAFIFFLSGFYKRKNV